MADVPAVGEGAPRTRRRLRSDLALAAAAGAVAAAGQAPVSLPWLTLPALAGLLALHLGASAPRRAAWIGWAGGTGYFAGSLFWIVEPFLVDVARHGWMAPFALIGLAGGLALFWAAAGWLSARLVAGPDVVRALGWALAISLAEAARSYVLTGFPWALVGHVWVDWPPMQLAAWIGPIGLTFLTLLIPAVALPVLAPRGPAGPRALAPRLGLALLPLAAPYVIGAVLEAPADPVAADAPVIRLVQPNAAQRLKWDPAFARVFWERQLEFTAAPAADGGRRPDLIVWPETAVPTLLNNAGPALERIAAAADGVPAVLGIQRLEGPRAFNSMILMDAAGEIAALYDKVHLVPFGEYMPLPGLMSRLGLSAFTAQQGFGYSPGPGAALIDAGPQLGRFLPLICYEAIFPQDLRAAPGRADWILQLTNDAWFGQVAGPYQHLAQARLRAVEQGLPVVRAANTGVSAVIDAGGRVRASLALGTAGYLDVALPPARGRTLYSRTGDAPLAVLMFLAFAGLAIGGRRKSD